MSPRPCRTPQEVAEVQRLYLDGVGPTGIAERLGIPRGSLHRHTKGLLRPGRYTEDDVDRALALHAGGRTLRETSRLTGIPAGTIGNWAARDPQQPTSPNPQQPTSPNGGEDPAKEAAVLAAARNAGRDVNRLSGKQRITLTSIADEAGVPVATVKRILESRKGGGFAAVTMDRVAGAATQSVENLSYLAELHGQEDYDALITDYGADAARGWIEKLDRDRRALGRLIARLRTAIERMEER